MKPSAGKQDSSSSSSDDELQVQRQKYEGGTAEENSDESGPPKPSDMKTAIDKEKKAEVFEDRRCICSTVNLGNWIQNRCARAGFPR